MASRRVNKSPKGNLVRGTYRKWDSETMERAMADCHAGMGVREAARKHDVPRGIFLH